MARDLLFEAAQRATELVKCAPSAERGRLLAALCLQQDSDPDSMTWLSGRQWNDLAAYVASLQQRGAA